MDKNHKKSGNVEKGVEIIKRRKSMNFEKRKSKHLEKRKSKNFVRKEKQKKIFDRNFVSMI